MAAIVLMVIWSIINYVYITIMVISVSIVVISLNAIRIHRKHISRGWRVGHEGRDSMYYEELNGVKWDRIELDGEMLCGKSHHIIYTTPDAFPKWALPRMKEISNRIRSEFKKPGYEYSNEEKWESAQQDDAPEPDSSRSFLSETTSRPGDL